MADLYANLMANAMQRKTEVEATSPLLNSAALKGAPAGWNPNFDWQKISAAETAAGRTANASTWQTTAYYSADNYTPEYAQLGQQILDKHLATPSAEGGGKEPDPGMGILGKLIGPALFAVTGNPALLSLGTATFGNTGEIGSTILNAGAAFTGGQVANLVRSAGGLSNFLSNVTGKGGFTNPAALGLSGSNLALPGLANAPAATGVAGYGASALGAGVSATAGALGGNPASLYSPASTKANPWTGSKVATTAKDIGKAAVKEVAPRFAGTPPNIAPAVLLGGASAAVPNASRPSSRPERPVEGMGFGGAARADKSTNAGGNTGVRYLLGA